MMDRVVPGGVAADLDRDGVPRIRETAAADPAAVSAPDRALRQYRLAAGPHRRDRRRCAPSWRSSSARPAMSDAPADAISMRGKSPATRLTIGSTFTVPVLTRGRRQCAGLDPHPRGRAERRADRANPRAPAGRRDRRPRSPAAGRRRRLGLGRRFPRRRAGLGAPRRRGASRAATCAIRLGFSGRCWKRRSRATSSPTSRSATNRSIARIRGTISDAQDVI